MFPAAKEIIGDGVEVATTVFVTIIVVVTGGEALSRIWASSCSEKYCLMSMYVCEQQTFLPCDFWFQIWTQSNSSFLFGDSYYITFNEIEKISHRYLLQTEFF